MRATLLDDERQGYRCLDEGWGNSQASDGVLKSPNNISKSVARILSQIALISSCIASNTVDDELRSGGMYITPTYSERWLSLMHTQSDSSEALV